MKYGKLFSDRRQAGQKLAKLLVAYRDEAPIVLGLPRGGVPVAYEVARALGAPLDVCVVRKLGAPIQPELAIGAVGEENALFVDHDTARLVECDEDELATLIATKRAEVVERVARFRRGKPPLDVRGKTVIVVDDGVATGSTVRAALRTLHARGAGRLVLAVPVGAPDSLDELAAYVDTIVCPHRPEPLFAVGAWYEDFSTTTDDDVVELLSQYERERDEVRKPESRRQRSERVPTAHDVDIEIPLANDWLQGNLAIPPGARGIVVFVHGSGSSRFSTRNRYVAGELQRAGIATLLFDLLTAEEEQIDALTGRLRFDIELLSARLIAVTDWIRARPVLKDLAIGYFGASTGAAAALVAAADHPEAVAVVVSRGGRPDLAGDALANVKAPVLLIVGSRDKDVLSLNREALEKLGGEKKLAVVRGATHLFEEPGTLEEAARLAKEWFERHLHARSLEASA